MVAFLQDIRDPITDLTVCVRSSCPGDKPDGKSFKCHFVVVLSLAHLSHQCFRFHGMADLLPLLLEALDKQVYDNIDKNLNEHTVKGCWFSTLKLRT